MKRFSRPAGWIATGYLSGLLLVSVALPAAILARWSLASLGTVNLRGLPGQIQDTLWVTFLVSMMTVATAYFGAYSRLTLQSATGVQIQSTVAGAHDYQVGETVTVGGMDFTDRIRAALKQHCGAVALSLEDVGEHYDRWRKSGWQNFLVSLRRLQAENIPSVLQIVLSSENFASLDRLVDFCLSQRHLYGVIFLARMLARCNANPACRDCGKCRHCFGGCPVMPLVDCPPGHCRIGDQACQTVTGKR